MKVGLKYVSMTMVDRTNVAAAMGSGDLDVFATPAMIALMENAAVQAVADALPAGSTTVGTLINVTHLRATGLGNEVSAVAELREIDGRRLVFHVSASDGKGIVGEGDHERFVVDTEKFMTKINAK